MSDEAVVVAARGLRKRWHDVVALDGVDLAVRRGEVVAVVGPSGGGKSTLLRCLNGLEAPDAGDVRICGAPLRVGARDVDRLRRRVGMVFQAFHLFPHLTVVENLALAPRVVLGDAPDAARDRARELLARVGLADRADARPSTLSGGQQQRVAIARALAMRPDALLFDEPTSALDPETVGEVLAVMREIARDGTTMIVVTHEISFAAEVSNRTVFMERGRVAEEGPSAALLRDPSSDRLRAFLARIRGR